MLQHALPKLFSSTQELRPTVRLSTSTWNPDSRWKRQDAKRFVVWKPLDQHKQPQQTTTATTTTTAQQPQHMTPTPTPLTGTVVNVAMLTSGGLAPCLSCAVAQLVAAWTEALARKEIAGLTFRFYRSGYKGLLTADSVFVTDPVEWKRMEKWNHVGGSPLGNSRVKLTNAQDCLDKGYIPAGTTPLQVAANQLTADNIHVLHTIGGDDTNTQAAHLSFHLQKQDRQLVVVGMPKTIDNDVYPIVETLGAHTAAGQGALFFRNVVNESTANPRSLILHEVMGRDSGSLTAHTAHQYRTLYMLDQTKDGSNVLLPYGHNRDIHAVWIPELPLDLAAEGARLKKVMDEQGSVHVFFGEGCGLAEIVADLEKRGEPVPRDAFGHVTLAKIKPGDYFARHLAQAVGAEKVLVQRSGYFARSAAADEYDVKLIAECAKVGVESALKGWSGCMGHDEDAPQHPMRAIEFERIKGGKPFDTSQDWFQQLLKEIGQPAVTEKEMATTT